MRPALFALTILLATAAGFLLGRSDILPSRGERSAAVAGRSPNRRVISLPVHDLAQLRAHAADSSELQHENDRLRAQVARLKLDLEPKPGSRREDGSIVGGARWSPNFIQMATGFIDSMLVGFLREAKLSPEQERRVRKQLTMRITQALAITAEFTNGDLEADQAYELLEAHYADGIKTIHGMLDERQIAVYGRFEKTVKDIIHSQVVHQELVMLNAELNLDPEQEKRIQAILDTRYRRVQDQTTLPLPNVLFKPIRRRKDKAIYQETASAIRTLLTPDQAQDYDRVEKKAPAAPYGYRSMLVAASGH